jgi:hypothetical protein
MHGLFFPGKVLVCVLRHSPGVGPEEAMGSVVHWILVLSSTFQFSSSFNGFKLALRCGRGPH